MCSPWASTSVFFVLTFTKPSTFASTFPFSDLGETFFVRIRLWSLWLLRQISKALLIHISASSLPLFKIYLFPFYMCGVFCLHVCLCTMCLSDTYGGQNRGVISPRTGVVDSCEIPCGCSDPLAAQPVLLQLELNWVKNSQEGRRSEKRTQLPTCVDMDCGCNAVGRE